ncbi:hypothetical protein F542_6640 [Bibersteinia trehalosi USDA-ARS-USMARC-188]|uniref:Uncharacterized protein n=4 Tax=Bibersteinia trehalosi TaxID=47735 RepID=W0R7R3_BIBTR|nr:hypothetical protein WQG_15420 [Bibersteinia trehalosi USDA-ARS-USMARC-192]AHG81382.1 hypothetical protein F542_6640 [Bibersteinia trehalosi USDA-ARS-USMARC-188]AHG83646.1 hypothetical protein F543_7820 [Bibersteinia trehalosi USDA-ARS-USMARC-189]AHG86806.1 hypothetical protein F544_15780 [Bibersteinia trehalosi USDA-ARS-USMARC-190]OAQ14954.1 hypothetical protein F480_09465 [Bibersteinia trehalosi Y31]
MIKIFGFLRLSARMSQIFGIKKPPKWAVINQIGQNIQEVK